MKTTVTGVEIRYSTETQQLVGHTDEQGRYGLNFPTKIHRT